MNRLRPPVLLLALWLFSSPALSAREAVPDAPVADGTSLFGLLQQGGWAMWPLGVLMLACFYLSFLCHSLTGAKRFIPPGFAALIVPHLRKRDFAGARGAARRENTVLSRLLAVGLTKGRAEHPDGNREAIEAAFVEAGEAEENAISQWVNYLNVVATVAPMVGLLGTVSGMISAFQTIGDKGMGKPQELAGSIGEALITTATGLVIGIPAMIAYFYFRNRLTTRMIEVGQEAGVLLDEVESPARSDARD
jgi:biopolymer transport protein ExbB